MPAPFPRWSNSAFAAAIAGLAGIVTAAVVLPWILVRTPYVTGQYRAIEQPIPFDHRHHVADDGIDCRYCHDLAWRSRSAGVPPTERCLNCHSQIWNESPLLGSVWESLRSGRPIAWRRVHRLPDFVYFDHSAHVNRGVACETCHGRVDRMARVEQVAPLTMGWCIDCHRKEPAFAEPNGAIRSSLFAGAGLPARAPVVSRGTQCTTCHR